MTGHRKKSETDVFGRMCPGINNEYDEEMRPISYSFFFLFELRHHVLGHITFDQR